MEHTACTLSLAQVQKMNMSINANFWEEYQSDIEGV